MKIRRSNTYMSEQKVAESATGFHIHGHLNGYNINLKPYKIVHIEKEQWAENAKEDTSWNELL